MIGYLGDATSLNPVIATDGQSYIAEWPIFDSLVELDEKLGVKPLLAESWEVSRDGLTYTFKLKKGVKWHDGKPFTARDVAFTFYSVLDPKVTTPHRGYFDALVGFPELTNKDNPKKPEELAQKPIEVIDDHTIRFRLRYPYGAFLAVLVNPRAGIIPEHLLKGVDLNTAEYNRKPIGTGPFKFVEWKRGERIVLEANPDYHAGRPALDRLIYRVIPDTVVLLQELRAGGVDFIERPPLTEVGRLKQTPGLKVLTADNTSYTYFGFRQDLAPFDDLRVRRALYHAIDIPAIVREVLQGYGGDLERAVPAGQLGVRPLGQALRLRPEPGQGAPRRGRLEARAGRDPDEGRQAPVLLAPARSGGSDRQGHGDHHPGVPEEGRRRGDHRAARLADVRQEALRVGLRGHRRGLDELPRPRSLRLLDLALGPVEGAELRPLQEPARRRGARGRAPGRRPGASGSGTTPSSRRSSWRTRRTSSSTSPSRSTSPDRATTGSSPSRPTAGSTSR